MIEVQGAEGWDFHSTEPNLGDIVHKLTTSAAIVALTLAFAPPAHAWTIGGFFNAVGAFFNDTHKTATGSVTTRHGFKAYTTAALQEKANAEKAGRTVVIGAVSMKVTMPDGTVRTYQKTATTSDLPGSNPTMGYDQDGDLRCTANC
jgi:predicted permease